MPNNHRYLYIKVYIVIMGLLYMDDETIADMRKVWAKKVLKGEKVSLAAVVRERWHNGAD